MKYLHRANPVANYLDHRLRPEVSAMFAAMSSRMPKGGIWARYEEIVEAVAKELWEEERAADNAKAVRYDSDPRMPSWSDATSRPDRWPLDRYRRLAEDRLCVMPIHPRVQDFFNQFVLRYGHSSILELTGQPAVYVEGVSWYTNYLLFDAPLCSGQEFSTRAVRHRDWPMARECFVPTLDVKHTGADGVAQESWEWDGHNWRPHPDLERLHNAWFEVFEAEVTAWAAEFRRPCEVCHGNGYHHNPDDGEVESVENLRAMEERGIRGIPWCSTCQSTGKKYPNFDKEPFRPALDRARWALPGTISTGCCHTGHLRERARALRDGLLLAQASKDEASVLVWQQIREGYQAALPALAGMGLREAVYGESSHIPGHLILNYVPKAADVRVFVGDLAKIPEMTPFARPAGEHTYVDPIFNATNVQIIFQCSLAVLRDWHRHRTFYPWVFRLVRDIEGRTTHYYGNIQIDHHYEPISEIGKATLPELLRESTEVHDTFIREGNQMKALLALPLGTRIQMSGVGGLRDAVYMLELRANAPGANFEYKEQATEALRQLRGQVQVAGIEPWLGLGGNDE